MNTRLFELLVDETKQRQETDSVHALGIRAVALVEELGLDPLKVKKLADRVTANCQVKWEVGESKFSEVLSLDVSSEPTGSSFDPSDVGYGKFLDIARAFSKFGYTVYTNRYSPDDDGVYIVELEIILIREGGMVAKLVTRVDNYNE